MCLKSVGSRRKDTYTKELKIDIEKLSKQSAILSFVYITINYKQQRRIKVRTNKIKSTKNINSGSSNATPCQRKNIIKTG